MLAAKRTATLLSSRWSLATTSWPAYTAWNAAKACFAARLAERGGVGNQEEGKVLDAHCHLIEPHGEARFSRLNVDYQHDSHAPRTVNKWAIAELKPFATVPSRAPSPRITLPRQHVKEAWGRPGLPSPRQANKALKAHEVLPSISTAQVELRKTTASYLARSTIPHSVLSLTSASLGNRSFHGLT